MTKPVDRSMLDRVLAFADRALAAVPSLASGPADEIAVGTARSLLAGLRVVLHKRTPEETLQYLRAISEHGAARLDVDSIASAVAADLARRETEPAPDEEA